MGLVSAERTRFSVAKCVLLVSALTAILGTVSVSPAFAVPVKCGDRITEDTTLHTDLLNCPDDGLVIGADGITLDLNGHRIDGRRNQAGNLVGTGINNREGHDRVTIKNGLVHEFLDGVGLGCTTENEVRGLTIRIAETAGIDLENSLCHEGEQPHHNVIADNVVQNVTMVAIRLALSDTSTVANNRTGSTTFGIGVSGDGNTVTDNTVSASFSGIAVGGDSNTIKKNSVGPGPGFGSNSVGIEVGGSDNKVIHNTATGGGLGIALTTGDRNVVAKNTASANKGDPGQEFAGSDGIFVGQLRHLGGDEPPPPPVGTRIEHNTANDNGDDGIDVDAPKTTVSGNTANNNGDLGIEAVHGVNDGGGNKASGNGNSAQCTVVACS